jgi:hypothetical protein
VLLLSPLPFVPSWHATTDSQVNNAEQCEKTKNQQLSLFVHFGAAGTGRLLVFNLGGLSEFGCGTAESISAQQTPKGPIAKSLLQSVE